MANIYGLKLLPLWLNETSRAIRRYSPEYSGTLLEEKLKEAETAQLIEGLYTSSMLDPLTGILNRKGLRDKLPDVIAQCKKMGKSLSLIY